MKNILIFDIGKVLVDFDIKLISKKLSSLTNASFDELHNFLFNKEAISDLFDKGLVTEKEFFDKIKVRFNLSINYTEFADIWCNIFTEKTDVFNLAEKAEKTCTLGVLSNTNKLHFEFLLDQFPRFNVFKNLHLSYELNAMKPDHSVYKKVIQYYNCTPEKITYIDDLQKNIESAKELGINALLFESSDKLNSYLESKKLL